MQAQSTDFLTPENKQQELGDGTGVQPPSLKVRVSPSLGWRWGGTGDPGCGLSSSQPSCAPQLLAEANRVQEQHGARQKALETCV